MEPAISRGNHNLSAQNACFPRLAISTRILHPLNLDINAPLSPRSTQSHPNSRNGQATRIRHDNTRRFARRVQFLEELLFNLHVLDDRFDY